ncbi:MAG: hypothetical protein JNK85_14735 [Verrucomicrobiales bacterium]|nr:hypothetical protein [Verrucomicrobiales bacterium]
MDAIVEFLNESGRHWWEHARGMAWQVALVVGVLWGIDGLLARKVSARWRHLLWALLLIKLMLPADLALPTSPAYFIRATPPAKAVPPAGEWRVSVGDPVAGTDGASMYALFTGHDLERCRPQLTWLGGFFLAWLSGSAGLLVYVAGQGRRWRSSLRNASGGDARSKEMLANAAQGVGLRRVPGLVVHELPEGPVVWGLARPSVVLPRWLVASLDDGQLRDVLLHEVAHVKRWDLWWNHLQTVLQILYWWHPLVWLGNARMRRVREEATDEAAVMARGGEPDSYAKTLIEVARVALRRPVLTLGLLGILESRHALRSRVERLADGPVRTRRGMEWVAGIGVAVLAMALLPLSPGPAIAAGGGGVTLTAGENVDVRRTTSKNGPPAAPALDPATSQRGAPPESVAPSPGVQKLERDVQAGFLRGESGVGFAPLNQANEGLLGETTFELAPLKVTVSEKEPRYWIGERPKTLQKIREQVRQLKTIHDQVPVQVRAESGAPFGAVAALMDAVRREGGEVTAAPGKDANAGLSGTLMKLQRIHLAEFGAVDEPLSNVVQRLVGLSRSADPEGTGIGVGVARGSTEPQPIWNEEKNAWVYAELVANPEIGATRITLDPPLSSVSLHGVLQAIVKGASVPLSYLIEEYGVSFRRPSIVPRLMTRTYRIQRESIDRAVGEGKDQVRDRPWYQEKVRDLLATSGVSWSPPNAVYYNDTQGLLMIRATAEEMTALESIIEQINAVPAMVQVEARLVEIPSAEEGGLGLNALLTAPASDDASARRGFLTESQVRDFLNACKQRSVSLAAAPRVTTLEGRQAAVEMDKKPTGEEPIELGSVAIDVVPRVIEDKSILELTILARVTALVSMKRAADGKTSEPTNGPVHAVNATGYINLNAHALVRLHDGQSVMLAFEPVSSNLIAGGAKGNAKRYVMLVTPTLIDPAGNRVNTPGKEPFDPKEIPEQSHSLPKPQRGALR